VRRKEITVLNTNELKNQGQADWLQPPPEHEGLRRYVETIRERLWLVVFCVVVTTGIAILYAALATKQYEGEANMLITPVSSSDPALASLGLIRESTDPTRDVETASKLITSPSVAAIAKRNLRTSESTEALLGKVSASPIASSNLVAITATDTSPSGARDIANAFANGVVEDRTRILHKQIEQTIPRLKAQLEQEPTALANATGSLASQVAELQALQTAPDPTVRVSTLATTPTAPSSPRRTLAVLGGLIAGLAIGIGAAFAAQSLDLRLRREAQLRRQYRLPILGRVPKEPRAGDAPLSPAELSPVASEAYRTLRATLTAGPASGKVILVTGSSSAEGKSTTAANLAASIALSGKRVILIEADLRRPVLASTLKVAPHRGGVVGVLIENVDLASALAPVEPYGMNLQVLPADYAGEWITDLFSIPAAKEMVEDARQMADYVVIDSPPINDVIDSLPLARLADSLLIVARLGTTRLNKLNQLAELLAENGLRPVGFAVVGTPRPGRREYGYHTGGVRRGSKPPATRPPQRVET
jgi:capsular exopolysaccharide synthesis family protein